jgi:hypothetical protein
VAEHTGGLTWLAAMSPKAEDYPQVRAALERLVRPRVLYNVQATTAWWFERSPVSLPFALSEGEGLAMMTIHDESIPWLKMSAELWRDNVFTTLPVVDDEQHIWGALSFTTSVVGANDADAVQLTELAKRSGAVTRFTSYLAGQTREPPPQPTGDSFGSGSVGTFGTSCGSGCGSSIGGRHPGSRKHWLERVLRTAWYDCGGALHSATIELETVSGEVASVGRAKLSQAAPTEMAACLVEQTWTLELPPMFDDDENQAWKIDVSPIFR